MKVSKHKVVSIDYKLTDDDGEIIDSSQGSEPLGYLHGVGNIVPGLERALEGKSIGDQLQVSVPPADAYGERNDELRQVVSRGNFGEVEDVAVGMRFRVPTEENAFKVVTVIEVGEENVTIDGNHDLAGMTLHFDVTVRDVREATASEIEHGHVHEDGTH